MNRRSAIFALACGLAGQSRIQYRAYHRCLPEYLAALVKEAYERRNRALSSLSAPEAIRTRQKWVRETFWRLAGSEPARTALNLRTHGSFERHGYRVEKLTYESQPGLVIPANLYIPSKGNPPHPGVLFQMGHSLNGKAAEPYQKCCQALAKLGYVVLAFDPMGQGERTYIPRLDNADEQHSRPGRQMLLAGLTATRMQTWDAVRSLDVLASHPLVDSKRLGSTGQSGGGTLTMFLAAVDERLSCAAVSCGNTENFLCPDFNPPGSVDDAEQNFLGGGPLGFDRWDTLYPFAPKPLWIAVSGRDYFGTYSPQYLTSGREEFAKMQQVYQTLGRKDAIEWYETPLPHALSHDLRVRIYNFFERHLRGSDARVAEPEVQPEPDANLEVGAGYGTTPLALTRRNVPRAKTGEWASLLRIERPAAGLAAAVLGTAAGERGRIEAVEVQSAPGVFVPAWVFHPSAGSRAKVLLVLEPRGRNARWKEGDLYPRLAAEGWTVCAFDLRGLGDMWPEVGRGNPFYTRPHAEEEAYAWASLMVGKPLLGQRVTDILAMAQAMRGEQTCLAALGHTTVPALCAAALDPKINRVYVAGGLPSWASLLESDSYSEPFANFVPGILERTDLPQIRESLGSRLKQGTAWDARTLGSL